MIFKLIIFGVVLVTGSIGVFAQQLKSAENITLRVAALKINVDDMDKALGFYGDKLGFEIADKTDYPRQVVLKTDEAFKLILNKVKTLRKSGDNDTGVGFTIQVNDLNLAIEKMKSLKVEFAETKPRKEGVGNAIYILDPFRRKISMMHQTIVKIDPFKEPKIYNFGLMIPDMKAGRDFYETKLGFVARSEKYLPLDMPLGHKDKTFAFMLHYRDGIMSVKSEYPKASPFVTMVFETEDLVETVRLMKQNNIKIVSSKKGESVVFEDPFGNISDLMESKK